MNTPDTITSVLESPFVAVVFAGDGTEVGRAYGTSSAEAEGQGLRLYSMAEYDWQSKKPSERPSDPPMWELYRRTLRVMPNGSPVFEAIRTRATVHHGFETSPGVAAK